MRRTWLRGGGLLGIAVLKELEKGPVHGYALMSRFEEVYGFRPSPGAIYPILKKLTEMGLVSVEERAEGGRGVKVYSLTDKGRRFLSERRKAVEKLEKFAARMKLAKEYGFTRLAAGLFWLFKNIDEIPPEKLEELSRDVKALCERIEKLRWVG
uniref:PadR family transcriptional regulator n=1 Tax=Fervidicoccus fontis TaxID=683846 RepID=A0A7J3ZKA9_9CREN